MSQCVYTVQGRKEGLILSAIDNVYNYYLSTYGSKQLTRYDTHKKSELRSVYDTMVKVNKESPLYKILGIESGEASKFAIDVKESSMALSKTALSLSKPDNALEGSFKKRVATSSDKDLVEVLFVGEEESANTSDSAFTMEVKQLAGPQINIGNYLPDTQKYIAPGQYSFDLTNRATTYEFQFGVSETDTNIDIQKKLARLINTANVGIVATIDSGNEGNSSLILTSKETGLTPEEEYLFEIVPAMDKGSHEALDILGIHEVAKVAQNSVFLLNGAEHTSLANNFTINKEFEITLKALTEEDKPIVIGFENDADAVYNNLVQLVDSYNTALSTAYKYQGLQRHIGKLEHDLRSVADSYHNELEPAGVSVSEDGFISISRELLKDTVTGPDADELFSQLNSFKNALYHRSNRIAINPMEYVNKIVVAYKNPGKNFSAPYATSMYAGMLYDRVC